MTEPSPCPDCDATETVTECTIGGRPGGRFVEVVHADSCPSLRGIV